MGITLKEHNLKPYKELCRNLETNRKCAYVAATGTGKSYVAAKYLEEYGLVGHELVLVPSDVIRRSWKTLIPGINTATYQGVIANPPDVSGTRIIVCDEMHHLGAEVWGRAYHGLLEGFTGKIVGLTATPVRYLDKSRDMSYELFDGNVVSGPSLPEAVSAGILPSFDYITAIYDLPGHIPKRSRKNEDTKVLVQQLDLMASRYSFQNILKKHLGPEGHKAAVFAPSIQDIPEIMRMCREVYPDSGHYIVHSGLSERARREAMDAFCSDHGQSFLYAVNMLNEGAHIDGIDTAVMFRKTESPAVYLQQLGRVLDNANAMTRVMVFDFVANHSNLKACMGGASSVIDWIMDGISDPVRQVVVSDYAMEEMELLDRIGKLLPRAFTQEEDDLIRKYYGQQGAVRKLAALMPGRTEDQIRSRASYLGVACHIGSVQTPEFIQDVKLYYGAPGGKERILALHPEANSEKIRYAARKLGLTGTRDAVSGWTPEEISILKANRALRIPELEKLLPGRTAYAIGAMKRALRLCGEKKEWPEDTARIILENPDAKPEELRRRFFPQMDVRAVAKRRWKVLHEAAGTDSWDQEKRNRFCHLYQSGNLAADPEFSWMHPLTVKTAAETLGLKEKRSEKKAWTAAEEQLMSDCIKAGASNKEIQTLFPGHTPDAVIQKKYSLNKKLKEKA